MINNKSKREFPSLARKSFGEALCPKKLDIHRVMWVSTQLAQPIPPGIRIHCSLQCKLGQMSIPLPTPKIWIVGKHWWICSFTIPTKREDGHLQNQNKYKENKFPKNPKPHFWSLFGWVATWSNYQSHMLKHISR